MTIILLAINDIEAAHAATDGKYSFLTPAGQTADGEITHQFAVFKPNPKVEAILKTAGVSYSVGTLSYETARVDRAAWLAARGLVMYTGV